MVRRRTFAAIVAAAVTLVLAATALAGGLPAPNSGTISVYVPSSVAGTSSQPKYQGELAFNTTGTGKLRNPLVWVKCYQNGAVVYGGGGSPSEPVKLGGDMSQWVVNGGGPASCTARLYYLLNAKGTGEWTGNDAQGGSVTLGETRFEAAG